MEFKFNLTGTFSQYQYYARGTAIYPNIGSNYIYPVISLAGEVGEISEKIKKIIRDKNGIISEEDKVSISKEIGDVTWYLSNLASELGLDYQTIAIQNLEKLYDRKARNKLKGSGDNR